MCPIDRRDCRRNHTDFHWSAAEVVVTSAVCAGSDPLIANTSQSNTSKPLIYLCKDVFSPLRIAGSLHQASLLPIHVSFYIMTSGRRMKGENVSISLPWCPVILQICSLFLGVFWIYWSSFWSSEASRTDLVRGHGVNLIAVFLN